MRCALLLGLLLPLALPACSRPGAQAVGGVAEEDARARVRGRATRGSPTTVRRHVTRERVRPPARTHLRIARRAAGWRVGELLELIEREAGQPIRYDPAGRAASARVEFVGALRIPRAKLFEWLAAVLSFHGAALVNDGGAWTCVESR